MFVDDLTCGGDNEKEALLINRKATKIFAVEGFRLLKWHSNYPVLEKPCIPFETDDSMTRFMKEHVGTNHKETKILRVDWNK